MTFIPPGENIVETKNCTISGEKFFVTDKDLDFYDKISPVFGGKKYSIPSPTLSPFMRNIRRMAWRNDRVFYHRKCDLTGKQFISTYEPNSEYSVYIPSAWYADTWDRHAYSKEVDFHVSFSEQYEIFMKQVPRIGIDLVNCENSDFCNYCGDDKDCYLDIAGEGNYRSFYNLFTKYSEFALDTTFVYNSKSMYESLYCYDCSYLDHCMYMNTSSHCMYSFNLKGCSDCMFSYNLRNKKYHIFNKSYTKEEYEKKRQQFLQSNNGGWEQYKKVFTDAIHRDYYRLNSENCTGNDIAHSSECYECYNINKSEKCKHLYDVLEAKHCYDLNYSLYHPEWSYELISTLNMKNSAFCSASHYSRNLYYCDQCNNSQDLFACTGLNHAKNCIFNKAYSVQEYEKLAGKMIDHMKQTQEWGEFFDPKLSAFGYEETVAHEYLPLDQEDLSTYGWKKSSKKNTTDYHGDFYTPLHVSQYDESIVGGEKAKENIQACIRGVLGCEVSGRPYKIIKQELAFYIEHNIPLPKRSPETRHIDRMHLRSPRKLQNSQCTNCKTQITTSYAKDCNHKVLCEKCYRDAVY